MSTSWRWDQGRLEYFNFNNIRKLALALRDLEGVELASNPDPLRTILPFETDLPFLPIDENYPIWRNYARVFKCQLLVAKIDGRLVLTDVCRNLAGDATNKWSAEDYFAFLFPRFYFPSPVFNDYAPNSHQIYPFCALTKFLLAAYDRNAEPSLTLDEVFSIIIGNNCSGTESEDYYAHILPTNYLPTADEKRQVREFLVFASQCSFLKFHDGKLYLDVNDKEDELIQEIRKVIDPIIQIRKDDPDEELISLGTTRGDHRSIPASSIREDPNDLIFIEGKKLRVAHLRIERSPNLRRIFFGRLPHPILCDMCSSDMKSRYPWVDNVLEVHHLLPLSSAIAFQNRQTSLEHLVPLCPTCHRSVHSYYCLWLRRNQEDDFTGNTEAKAVYEEAKYRIAL